MIESLRIDSGDSARSASADPTVTGGDLSPVCWSAAWSYDTESLGATQSTDWPVTARCDRSQRRSADRGAVVFRRRGGEETHDAGGSCWLRVAISACTSRARIAISSIDASWTR